MSPPTSIDGTDITGATIDGTDVQEITVDGQTVFTAETLPVAYSNLIAWYPFDSSFYGGSNADDATALFNSGQSGDSTAYDGTVSGATYQSSAGVKDINAGANSGAFDFDGSNDTIDITTVQSAHNYDNPYSVTAWFKSDSVGLEGIVTSLAGGKFDQRLFINSNKLGFESLDTVITSTTTINAGTYFHAAGVKTSSGLELYVDGSFEDSASVTGSEEDNGFDAEIGLIRNDAFFDGNIEDVRIYNKALTSSEVSDIYNNTKP